MSLPTSVVGTSRQSCDQPTGSGTSEVGYLLIGTNNTAHKLAEEALLKAGALQRAIFDSANFSKKHSTISVAQFDPSSLRPSIGDSKSTELVFRITAPNQ